ncbi:hypothetical protein IAT38_004942 [Cryptococcus sp. DSM 104549]
MSQPPNSQGNSSGQAPAGDKVFEDPANVLGCYPFMTYAPTARVAQHLAPHTATYPPQQSSGELYPQYTQVFSRLDNPSTIEDWAMRQAAEARIREALGSGGRGYAQQPVHQTPQPYYTQTGSTGQGGAPLTPNSNGAYPQPGPDLHHPQPMPYNFLPSYVPPMTPSSAAQSGHHPLTPTSMLGDSPAPSPRAYFEGFVKSTLGRMQPSPSGASQGQPGSQVRPPQGHQQQPQQPPVHQLPPQFAGGQVQQQYHQTQSHFQPQQYPQHHPHSQPPLQAQPYSQPQIPPQSQPLPQVASHSNGQLYSQLPQPHQQQPTSHPPLAPYAQPSQYQPNTFPGARGNSPIKRPSIASMAMRSPHPPSSVSSTPTHERNVPPSSSSSISSSPDPLGLPGPSPSKRPRKKSSVSPTFEQSANFPPDGEIGLGNMGSLSVADARARSMSVASASTSVSGPSVSTPKVVLKIPARPAMHPSSEDAEGEDEDEEDALDWGEKDGEGDWRMDGQAQVTPQAGTGAMSVQMSGRTGERDTRTSWQKLQTLLEDISEESDAFPANPTMLDLNKSRFFSTISKDGTTALLSVSTIAKVGQYVSRVQSATKRQKSLAQTNGEAGEWDVNLVGGLLRLLERSMRDAENAVVFPEDRKAVAASVTEEKGKKKKAKGKKDSTSSPTRASPEGGASEDKPSEEMTAACELALTRAKSGVAAAECCLALLDSDGLSKQVYSEDLLTACVGMIKDQVDKIVIPIVQGLAGDKIASTYLAHIVEYEFAVVTNKVKQAAPVAPYFLHPTISSIAQSTCSAIPRLTSLISKPDLAFSDSLVIQTVYLAIAPLFVSEPAAFKKSKAQTGKSEGMAVVKTLRMEALGCLRGAFARYEEQRQWIIEEILSSLVKPEQNHSQAWFQLANGKSIHTIAALLLQLIQASAYGVADKVRKLHSQAAEMEIVDDQAAPKVDPVEEEAKICADTIESALRSASMVAAYVVSKSTASKASKSSLDNEYKTILDLLINDLLSVLYQPEWPAAALFLSVFSRIMIQMLDESKAGADASAKGVALDYLGDIAARLKALHLEMTGGMIVPTIDEAIAGADVVGMTALINAQASVHAFLNSAARDDGSFACSRDMSSIVWAQELQVAIKKATAVLEKLAAEKDAEAQETSQKLQSLTTTMKNTLRGVWMGDDGLFEISDPKQGETAAQASIAVSRGRSLQSAIDPILIALLSSMDNTIVAVRTKALRGVASVVMVDPDVLGLPQIRQALEERLSDASPAVRDAAVELVGKYLVQKPKLAMEYYPHIAQRTMDTGLSVRKRVIKLLRGIFSTTGQRSIQVDICCKIIVLASDKDEGIKDLAIKTLTDILYSSEGGDAAGLLVDILSDFRGSLLSLEKALNGVAKECENVGQTARLGKTIDDLIGRLIDATEQSEFDSLSHIRAIWLLGATDPSQIDTHKAGVLLSYLRPPANADDQAGNELLLRIFQKCIPRMPRTASTFAQDLTKALMPMITKPSGGFQALKETIGCLCAVTNHLTKDWARLITVLRACEAKIRPMRNAFKTTGKAQAPNQASAMMLYITALIVEGCKLDEIAKGNAAINTELRKITPQPIAEYLFEVYLDFAHMPASQTAPTICLGSLFRTYPYLLQRSDTTQWMTATFRSNDMDSKARLLGVIYEFLASEVEKRSSGEVVAAKKDVSLLIGNAKELQDSDYSTTIVQNNIEQIFECARSQHAGTQNAALDVLTFVVNQGLYSPVHTVPILVTLETSDNPAVAERALSLHAALHNKHASLVTVLFLESAKASYEYQRSISAEPPGQRGGLALLSSWYGLLSEKRAWRHDFLKALCRAFDQDLDSQVDVGFVLYLAENLATFDYKLQEEPMTVVQALSRVVSTCSHLASLMEEATLAGEPQEQLNGRTVDLSKTSGEKMPVERLVDASIVVGLALLVKNHLVALYHLQEDKCASHVAGKKSAVGDRPAQRRGPPVLELSRMPLVRGVQTVGEFKEHQATFLGLLHEDGSLSDGGHSP